MVRKKKNLTLYGLRVIWNTWELLGFVHLSCFVHIFGVLSFSFTLDSYRLRNSFSNCKIILVKVKFPKSKFTK